MEKNPWILMLALVVGAILLGGSPVAAQAGNGTGACGIEFTAGNQDAIECIDDVTESECSSFCSGCKWFGGETCAEQGVPWEGSCFFDDTPPGGGCWLWAVEQGSQTAEFHCEETFDGTWSDDLVCGGQPVPAMPRTGQAALVLVMLVGALIILGWRGSILAG